MKSIYISLMLLFSVATAAVAEMRTWTLNNGKTLEAEFVSLIGGKVALRTARGKIIKIPRKAISAEDKVHIELCLPPTLDFSFSKTTAQHVYPPLTGWFEENNVPPRSIYYSFSTQIKQTSANPYHHALTAEIFVMAVEVGGDKNILIDYRKETFRLDRKNLQKVQIPGVKSLMLTTYLSPDGTWRGEKYAGYLIVVTDTRGEVVSYSATRDWWFDTLDHLRRVPVGKTFDREGNRCWPTRPKESSY